MFSRSILEHEKLWCGDVPRADGDQVVPSHLFARLESFERRMARQDEDRVIFRWGKDTHNNAYVSAMKWVGVVQVPGLSVEILPKTEWKSPTEPGGEKERKERAKQARGNLLYMLQVAGDVELRERDMAQIEIRSASLIDALVRLFALRLKEELLRGLPHDYVTREDNLRVYKGRLDISRQIQLNAAHRERVYMRFDEFSSDILLNRIFRAACLLLVRVTHNLAAQADLSRCLQLLDEVGDQVIQEDDFERLSLTRQNERFRVLLGFCRMVLLQNAPVLRCGGEPTFTLLFDMEKLFERFIAQVIRRYVMPVLPVGESWRLTTQGQGETRYLVMRKAEEGKNGVSLYRLKPDVMLTRQKDQERVILDTKWKLPVRKKRERGDDDAPWYAAQSDMYQMYAYATRYDARTTILLYPQPQDPEARLPDAGDKYLIPSVRSGKDRLPVDEEANRKETEKVIHIRTVNLNRDLRKETRGAVAGELKDIILAAGGD